MIFPARAARACALVLLPVSLCLAQGAPREIAVYPEGDEGAVRGAGCEIWDRGDGFVVAGVPGEAVTRLAANRVEARFSVPDRGQALWLLSHESSFVPPELPGAIRFTIDGTQSFYLIPAGSPAVPRGAGLRAKFRGVPRIALPERRPHPADLAAGLAVPPAPAAALPLVQQIVNATSQASWYQFVREISGDLAVDIPGTAPACTVAGNCRIMTRESNNMFPPNGNGLAFATEYLFNKGAGWGFTGANAIRENYTAAESGCASAQTKTWQNAVFTLPGQVDYGQHQQVIFLVHYDSLAESAAMNATDSRGADDAMSGGSALLEAMRLYKNYGWQQTVKFLFVSGEEYGLCGSIAYTRQHPMADVWRVLNMDQTAYDGDKNGVMNLYNWDAVNCPACVAFGDAFAQANADYGAIIAPAKLYRNQVKMCQTDHCSFWNAGAVAIDLNEDLSHNDIHPCFDNLQTPTCRDTVTHFDPGRPGALLFDQNYSWPTEKAAIALIAHTAVPLYACPAAGATLSATGGPGQAALSWGAVPPVTNYVIERAAGGCGGSFAGIAQVAGPGYTDTAVTNGQLYGYRIRTCPFQVSNCVAVTPNGPSVNTVANSALVTADTGDHDAYADNCERVGASVTVINDGNLPLTNVRLTALAADSPAVRVVSPVPYLIGSLAVGATAPLPFKFDLGRGATGAACQQTITYTATLASDQTAPAARGFAMVAEQDAFTGTLSWGFETGGNLQGWTVSPASPAGFTQVAGGPAGSTAFSLHSGNASNGCYQATSPLFTPSATSALTMSVNYAIEAGNYDRAVMRAVNPATAAKTLLTPTGAVYNTTAGASGLCDGIGALQGWSGAQASWRAANFNLAAFAGAPIRLEAGYSTDGSLQGAQGFWFDAVQVTNATQLSCDAQSNVCAARPPEVSPAGAAVPFTIGKSGTNHTLRFSESAGAAQYHVYAGTLANLSRGYYDHGAASGLCGFTDALPGDGQVTATVTASNLPDNAYFLAVAAAASGESPYGSGLAADSVPVALNACP